MRIGIIGAMSVEVEALKDKLEGLETVAVSGIEFHCGRLCGKDVVVAKCGIGKVFAAMCAQTMIIRFDVTHVINTGVGGTLSADLDILDIAIADGVVQHDMDTSPIGDPVGLISGINKVVLPTSSRLATLARNGAVGMGKKCAVGIIASGDQFIASREKKNYIRDNFSAIACEMEGAAIGHVCYVNETPFAVIRAISDTADDSSHMDYGEFLKRAAERSFKVVTKFVEKY